MKTRTYFTTIAAIAIFMVSMAFSVSAQRKRTRTVTPKPVPVLNVKDTNTGAGKVAVQIKNTTKFLYTLGSIAKGIEDIDKAVMERKASMEVGVQNAKFKQNVIQSIQNLRAGMADLEVDFRTKPDLKPYLFQIQGISDITATAEDQARSGQLHQSGKTLLFVVEKLADTLAAMSSK